MPRSRLVVTGALLLSITAAAQNGADPEDWVLAVGLLQRGLHAEAAERFESFLEHHPGHPRVTEANYRLGVCRIESGDPAGAVEVLKVAVRDQRLQLRPEARYRLGGALHTLGRHEPAAREYERLLAEIDDAHYLAAPTEYAAGEAWRDAGDDPQALPHFVTAAALAGDTDPAGYGFSGRYQAGFVHLRGERFAEAHAAFADLATRFPAHAALGEVQYFAGEAAYRAGRYDEAATAWDAARRSKGEHADDALLGLAWCRRQQDRDDDALKLFERVGRDHGATPLGIEASLEIARIRHERGEHRAAVETLDELLARDDVPAPTRVTAHEIRGLSLLAAGDSAGAEAALQQALAAGDTPRLRYGLAESCAGRGEWERAAAEYERAAATDDPELRGDARYGWSVALHELGDYEGSVRCAAQFVAEQPQHRLVPLASFAIAENLFVLERWDVARSGYDALGDEHPLVADARFKAAWCSMLGGQPADAAARFGRCAEDQRLDADRREQALSLQVVALHDAGELTAALQTADRYLARHPKGEWLGRTERIAARALQGSGDRRAAATRLARAERAAGDAGPGVALERADLLFAEGDFRGAHGLYLDLASRDDEVGFRACEGMAWCAFELGEDADCLLWLERGAEHAAAGDRAGGLRSLEVHLHHRRDDWTAAIAAAQSYLRSQPDGTDAAEVRYLLGVAQARSGDPAAARATLTPMTLSPLVGAAGVDRPDLVLYELAWACDRSGDAAAGLDYFQQLAALPGADADLVGEAHLHLGEAAIAAGRFEAARGEFAAVTGRHRGRALYRTGQSWLTEQQPAKAAASFRAVLELGDREQYAADARLALGETLLLEGDAAAAMRELDRFVREHADHPRLQRARLYLGEAAIGAGSIDPALAAFRTYLDAGGEGDDEAATIARARAHLGLGRAYALRNDPAHAEEEFVETTRLSKGELAAEAQFRIGEVRRAKGDLDGAVDAFVKLSILYTHDAWVPKGLLEAARCYEQLGQDDKAQRFYRELRERFGGSSEAREAERRIGGG